VQNTKFERLVEVARCETASFGLTLSVLETGWQSCFLETAQALINFLMACRTQEKSQSTTMRTMVKGQTGKTNGREDGLVLVTAPQMPLR